MIYLLDTCVWRDFFEDRTGIDHRPLGKSAHRLFMRILKEDITIIFSDALVTELKLRYSQEEIGDMFAFLDGGGLLERIETTQEEFAEAKMLRRERDLPLTDCLNAIHARNHGAVLISQDKHLLVGLADICQAFRPEDVC